VKSTVAQTAHELMDMYRHVGVLHGAEGLTHMETMKAVAASAEAAAAAAYTAASTAKDAYDVALRASKHATNTMTVLTRALTHYIHKEAGKARADDMVFVREMPKRLVVIVEGAVRSTLLGILKSREEASVMQADFVSVMNSIHKVNAWISALRRSEQARDKHGHSGKAKTLKAKMKNTAATMKGATGDIAQQAADAHAHADPVARANATDTLVASKATAVTEAVVDGLHAHADLVKEAPAEEVSHNELADSMQAMTAAVVGDGKEKGLIGELHDAQTGPSAAAQAVVAQR
jgi:hypothetical protein